jgi:hypothetical protein
VIESSQVGSVSGEGDFASAEFVSGYRQVEAEIHAVPESELLHLNLDIPSAVATVLGALPEIQELHDEMAGLSGFDIARISRLRTYAWALGHAHAMHRAAIAPPDSVAELAERAADLREILHADATALAKRGHLEEASVAKLKSGLGYKNLAIDLVGLVGLFRDHWDGISSKTAVEPAELEEAGQLAQRLITTVGLREQAPAVIEAASLTRQKAFTLLAKAYDDARRAVTFLRWHEGDVDSIAPSLYAGRGGRKKAATLATPAPQAPVSPPFAG